MKRKTPEQDWQEFLSVYPEYEDLPSHEFEDVRDFFFENLRLQEIKRLRKK